MIETKPKYIVSKYRMIEDIRLINILKDLLVYEIKKEDYPISAETHFAQAIVGLCDIVGKNHIDKEFMEIIDYYRCIVGE